jgi:hypothetical protein
MESAPKMAPKGISAYIITLSERGLITSFKFSTRKIFMMGGHREHRSPGAYFLRGSYRPEEPTKCPLTVGGSPGVGHREHFFFFYQVPGKVTGRKRVTGSKILYRLSQARRAYIICTYNRGGSPGALFFRGLSRAIEPIRGYYSTKTLPGEGYRELGLSRKCKFNINK